MSEAEATARAERMSGYGMINKVATASGSEDWFGETNAAGMNLLSLDDNMKLNGTSGNAPLHEDVFQATVKDFANQAYRTILLCYKDLSR
jgi:hypothetical protein